MPAKLTHQQVSASMNYCAFGKWEPQADYLLSLPTKVSKCISFC